MKGGFNNPPNERGQSVRACEAAASMKGGFNNPPNSPRMSSLEDQPDASMKGGFNNPPNGGAADGHNPARRLQ